MAIDIQMGNDEFILYIRKKPSKCSLTNDQLGKMIWVWILENDKNAIQVEEDKPSLWGKTAMNIGELGLPKTACQFEFNRSILNRLYGFLDELGSK
jgi:hypothetical protein